MDRNSMITSVVAALALCAAILGGVQGCTANARQNTVDDTKRMTACTEAGGSWILGRDSNFQCIVTAK